MRSFQESRPSEIVVHTSPKMLEELFPQLKPLLAPAQKAGFDTSRVYLMLDELLSNIYRHGYGERDNEPIGLRLRLIGNYCQVAVRDLAPTFDSARHAETRKAPPPDSGATGGMGLFIVQSMCDSFVHQVPKEGGNALYVGMTLIQRGEPARERAHQTNR